MGRTRKERNLTELTSFGKGSGVSDIFRYMQIAEEEIKVAKKKATKKKQKELHSAFSLMIPTGLFESMAEDVYRDHCRELLARAATGHDTRHGTRAEMMAALSVASLAAPLKHDYAVLFEELFRDIMAKHKAIVAACCVGEYTHTGAREDAIERLRRRLYAAWRRK